MIESAANPYAEASTGFSGSAVPSKSEGRGLLYGRFRPEPDALHRPFRAAKCSNRFFSIRALFSPTVSQALHMRLSPLHLLLVAVPPVTASFAVLALAGANKGAWVIQFLAVCLAGTVALAGAHPGGSARNRSKLAAVSIFITLASLATPLLSNAAGPERWIALGPLNLYVAPAVLPTFLVAFSALVVHRDRRRWLALAGAVGASALLAVQPDASQVLALLVGVLLASVSVRLNGWAAGLTVALVALAAAWAFSRPDPLEPVPHVEGVFLLALGHSTVVGTAAVVCAVALIAGLYLCSARGLWWLSAVASYYAVLFVLSVGGLTPAPLIGYGAGPVLGFGLMVAMSSWAGAETPPGDSVKATPDSAPH